MWHYEQWTNGRFALNQWELLCDVHHHEWNMRSSLFHFRSTEFDSVFSFVCICHNCAQFIVCGKRCVVLCLRPRYRFESTKNSLETNSFALYFSSSENFTNVTGLRCAFIIIEIVNDFMNATFNFTCSLEWQTI